MTSERNIKKTKILSFFLFFHSFLVFLIFLSDVILSLQGVNADFFVILLKGSHVLPGLRELSFLHAFPDIPVDESPLCIHQVELVVEPGPGLSNSCGVAEHANSPLHLGQVTSWHH